MKQSSLTKKLLLFLPLVALVLASVITAYFVIRKDQTKITTYDYLPLEIDNSGVITQYNGLNDGSVSLEIPASYDIDENGKFVEGTTYNVTSIAPNAFKNVEFYCLKINSANITSFGASSFEGAKNVYIYGESQGYVIGEAAFKNARVKFDKIYVAPNGSNAAIGKDAFLGAESFDTNSLKAAGNPGELPVTTLATDGIIKFADGSLGSGVTSVDLSNFDGTVIFDQSAAQNNIRLSNVSLGNGSTEIGDNAFNGCTQLNQIEANGDISSIGEGAFKSSGLLDIDLSTCSLTEINDSTFENCSEMLEVSLGDSIESVGANAFKNCDSLETVTIDSTELTQIGQNAFDANCTIYVPLATVQQYRASGFGGYANQLAALNANMTVTYLNNNNQEVIDVIPVNETIPNNVISNAGIDSSKVISIDIPFGVKIIGERAFINLSNITSVEIVGSVELIDEFAFEGCAKLTDLVFDGDGVKITNCAFRYCDLDNVELGENFTIGGGAFSGSGLNSITIPQSTIFQGNALFYGTRISEITIPDSVTKIESYTFYSCSNLSTIHFNGTITRIEGTAFSYSGITKEAFNTIINGVEYIGDSAFAECHSLTEVVLPNSVKELARWVFDSCTALKKVKIGSSVTTMGKYCFERCYQLEEVDLDCPTVGQDCFWQCALTKITLREHVTELKGEAFYNGSVNNALVKIYSPMIQYGQNALSYKRNGNYYTYDWTIYVASEYVEDYKNATQWQMFDIQDIAELED